MHIFKIALSFLAVGGATYALIKINEAPPWLIAATLAMAIAALITALPYLPQAIDAIESAAKKIAVMVPATLPPAQPRVRREPSTPRYEPPQHAPEYHPPRIETRPKCAALVMSNQGGWGASAGRGLPCTERLEQARSSCSTHTSGQCGNYAAGPWVAGIHCGNRVAVGIRRNSFAGYGTSEAEAFARAYQHASAQGFPSHSCKRRVSLSAYETAPRRYD